MTSFNDIKNLSRHLCIPMKQHHVIVHRDGRFYFRKCAKMPTQGKWHISQLHWRKNMVLRLTISPVKEGCKLGIPLTPSRRGTVNLNFRSQNLAAKFLQFTEGENMRVRIIERTRIGPKGVFRISLAPVPVKDIYSIWQDMTKEDFH